MPLGRLAAQGRCRSQSKGLRIGMQRRAKIWLFRAHCSTSDPRLHDQFKLPPLSNREIGLLFPVFFFFLIVCDAPSAPRLPSRASDFSASEEISPGPQLAGFAASNRRLRKTCACTDMSSAETGFVGNQQRSFGRKNSRAARRISPIAA